MTMEQKRTRHSQFFQPLEKGEGGYLAITSPINDSQTPPYPILSPSTLEERWFSTEYRLKGAEANIHNTYWGQDAIQNEFVNLGPGVQAAMLGAPYKVTISSIWFDTDPPLKNWDNPPKLTTDFNHPLHKVIDEHTKELCAASNGRYAVSTTDIGGQLDVLYSLRGEDLLMDFIEYPEEVLAMQAHLDEEFLMYFNHQMDIIMPTGLGCSSWMPIVSDMPYYPIQCDVSAMFSPAMFEKFALPSLDKVSSAIGNSIYHLDGPGEIPHLDMLLSLKHVHSIQWVPLPQVAGLGPTSYSTARFEDEMSLDIYRRTKAAGKKVVLLGVPPSQIETIYNAVGSDGVFICTYINTRKDADALIEHAHQQKWLR